MASNPLFIIPDFLLHFPNELCYGYLRFEGIFPCPSLGKYKKSGIMKSGLDTMPLFLQDDLINRNKVNRFIILFFI